MSSPPKVSSRFFLSAILNDTEGTESEELLDDVDEVKEFIGSVALLDIQEAEEPTLDIQETEMTAQRGLGQQSVSRILSAASKAVKDRTDAAYRSLMITFNKYCIEEKFIAPGANIYKITKLDPETDLWIIAWVMAECDGQDRHGRPHVGPIASWSKASKMRSAVSMGFGIDGAKGSISWDAKSGLGNPSLSLVLARYFRGLHRRKVQIHGEVATSSRAISADMIRQLYLWNIACISTAPDTDWCGPKLRRCLHAIYCLAFVCLLRIDEVLRIQVQDIKIEIDELGIPILIITLLFRKTHQLGNIKPFIIRRFPESMSHLCPVRAVIKWLKDSGIQSGPLFRPMDKYHEPLMMSKRSLGAQSFCQYFRNNLDDIGIDDVYSFATHSFRRGGTQWLSADLRWPLRQILLNFYQRWGNIEPGRFL